MSMPSAAEYLGTASGLPGAKDYPWGKENLVDADGQNAAVPKEYSDAQVNQHYSRQRAMVQKAAELAYDILNLQADVQVFLDGIEQNEWDLLVNLQPFPMDGNNSYLRVTDLAPALAVAEAFVGLAAVEVPGPAVYDANLGQVVPGPTITGKKALHAIARPK